MIAGPRTVARSSTAPSSITTRPSTRESTTSPSIALLEVVEDQPVGLEHVLHLPGVLPPAVHDVRVHALAALHHRLDRVGDLELVAPGGLDRARRVEDRRGEHVHAHQRQVRSSGPWASPPAAPPRRRRSARPRRSSPGSGTGVSRISASGLSLRKLFTRSTMPSRSRLSPRYITKGDEPRNGSAVSTACARPLGSSCSMYSIFSPKSEPSPTAVADLAAGLGRDDDPHLDDAGLGHRLEPVEEHGLVRHRHELLGARVRERAQARALAARQDQALQLIHQ